MLTNYTFLLVDVEHLLLIMNKAIVFFCELNKAIVDMHCFFLVVIR
jgi:hypothetical protein